MGCWCCHHPHCRLRDELLDDRLDRHFLRHDLGLPTRVGQHDDGRGRHGHGAAGCHHREPVLLQGPEDLPAHLRHRMPRGLKIHAAFQRFPEVLRSPEVLRFGFKVFAQRAFHVFVRRVVTGHGRKPLWRRPLQVGPGADRVLGLAWI